MRAIFLVLMLVIVGLLVLFSTGLLNLNQTEPAVPPKVSVNSNGVTTTAGQAPAFDVETGSVTVGTKPANVTVAVPSVEVNRPGNQAGTATNRQ